LRGQIIDQVAEQREKIGFTLYFVDNNQTLQGLQSQLRMIQSSQVPWAFEIEIMIEFKALGDSGFTALAFA